MTSPAPPTVSAPDALDALPVSLVLTRSDAARVQAWIEGVLGWQPVEGGPGGLPARVRIVDVAGARSDETEPAGDGVPALLLVAPDDPPLAVARAAARWCPAASLLWPDDRDALVDTCRDLLARARPDVHDGLSLRIGGAAGGVGTTTVALGLGALAAWRSGPTLVATWGVVPLPLARTVELDSLAGQRTFEEAPTVAGVPGLRVVRAAAPPREVGIEPGPADVVIRDVGVRDDVDVLVLRRDAAGVAALERSPAAVAVVLDDGPAPAGAVAGAAGGRPVVLLPRSTRVARAGLLGRVPTALPASYLRSLQPLIAPERGRGR